MSSEDQIDSTVLPERPTDPTHFGGNDLCEPKPGSTGVAEAAANPPKEPVEGVTKGSLQRAQHGEGSLWNFAKRNHLPTLIAVGGIIWLLASLVRRSTERQ